LKVDAVKLSGAPQRVGVKFLGVVGNSRIARVLFFVYERQMVLLHGFIKKTQQTPEDDLDLAVRRQKEVKSGKAAK
jgi:phage-related protein